MRQRRAYILIQDTGAKKYNSQTLYKYGAFPRTSLGRKQAQDWKLKIESENIGLKIKII